MSQKYSNLWWALLAALILTAAAALFPWQSLTVSGKAETGPILIIDAGHGGADGGAVAPNGTLECDLNLDIALRLQAAAEFFGVPCIMTRETAELTYPDEAATIAQMKKADQNRRLALINSQSSAVLLSIHQNFYPAAAPRGVQVFFNDGERIGDFADLLQRNLTVQLCPDNRRVAEKADEGIYLMRCSEQPAVLVECGFISNPDELALLETPSYRMKLAVIMLSSYLQYTSGVII